MHTLWNKIGVSDYPPGRRPGRTGGRVETLAFVSFDYTEASTIYGHFYQGINDGIHGTCGSTCHDIAGIGTNIYFVQIDKTD